MAVSAPTALCQFLSSSGVTTSGAITTGTAVPAGTFVKVSCWGATASTTFGVSDSKSNTWTALTQEGNTGGSALVVVQEFYSFLTTALTATDTITATRTSSNSLGFFANTYTGVQSVGTVLVNAVTSNNTAVTFGSSLVAQRGDMIEAFISWSNATAGTVGAGYTKPLDAATTVTNARRAALEYQRFASGGSSSPTFTAGGTPQWAATATLLVAGYPPPPQVVNRPALIRASVFCGDHMAEQYTVICPSTALSAATAKTLIELTCGSTIDAVLTAFDVGFDGVSSSAVPVKVELITYTTTGTGTGYTPNRIGQNQGRASITTAKNVMTVEGTGSITVVANWVVSPTSTFSYMFPLGREVSIPPSKSLGLRVTAPAIVNATANCWIEE